MSLLVGTMSCSITGPDDDAPSAMQLRAHWARWQSVTPSHYTFVLRTSCFCPPSVVRPVVRIEVRDGRVIHAQDVEAAAELPVAGYPSIDSLFSRAIDELTRKTLIAIQFDRQLGYPTLIQTGVPTIADSGVRWEVAQLSSLP